jgi:hypothetical protein
MRITNWKRADTYRRTTEHEGSIGSPTALISKQEVAFNIYRGDEKARLFLSKKEAKELANELLNYVKILETDPDPIGPVGAD